MERLLASLTLDPQITVDFLSVVEFKFPLDVDLLFLRLTLVANDIIACFVKDLFAAHTSSLNNCESTQTNVLGHLWLRNISNMLSREQGQLCLFGVIVDGLENSDQRKLDLVLDIIAVIDWQVVFKNEYRVFRFLVVLRAFCSLHDDICNSISDYRCGSLVSLLHLLCQTYMGRV